MVLFVRSFGWLVGCLHFDCVSGGHVGGCGVCGDGNGDDGGGGDGGVNGGNIVSLHSCWLCSWLLGWSASTQINKELITTTTTTSSSSSSSSSSSFLHANAGQTGYLAAIQGHKVYMITFIKIKYDAVLSGTRHISH